MARFPYADHDPADEQPPRYLCDLHKWADDDWPCDRCESDDQREVTEEQIAGTPRGRAWQAAQEWERCAEHRIHYRDGEWCPVCFDDACREAKAVGETMPRRRRASMSLRIAASVLMWRSGAARE